MHYHIMTGTSNARPLSNVKYENLKESVGVFVRLGNEFFGNTGEAAELNFENALDRTDKFNGFYVGTSHWMIVWTRCDQLCTSPLWS